MRGPGAGPLVYCIETADLPSGTELEEIELEDSVRPTPVARPDIAEGLIGLTVPAVDRYDEPVPWTNGGSGQSHQRRRPASGVVYGASLTIGAIPYFAWANRSVDAMRVWIPRRTRPDAPGAKHGGR